MLLMVLAIACRLEDDADGDGYRGSDDCDDTDPDVHPSNDEVCDGIDNDCDGDVDVSDEFAGYVDGDGDGIPGTPSFTVCDDLELSALGDDCDDTDEMVGQHMPELCGDETDNDCEGTIDNDRCADWAYVGGQFGDAAGKRVATAFGAPTQFVLVDGTPRLHGLLQTSPGEVDVDWSTSLSPPVTGIAAGSFDGVGYAVTSTWRDASATLRVHQIGVDDSAEATVAAPDVISSTTAHGSSAQLVLGVAVPGAVYLLAMDTVKGDLVAPDDAVLSVVVPGDATKAEPSTVEDVAILEHASGATSHSLLVREERGAESHYNLESRVHVIDATLSGVVELDDADNVIVGTPWNPPGSAGDVNGDGYTDVSVGHMIYFGPFDSTRDGAGPDVVLGAAGGFSLGGDDNADLIGHVDDGPDNPGLGVVFGPVMAGTYDEKAAVDLFIPSSFTGELGFADVNSDGSVEVLSLDSSWLSNGDESRGIIVGFDISNWE